MSQTEQLALSIPTLSITNFNLPSLHLLHQEIVIILKDTEYHLTEFNDDKQKAALLLESIEVLKQLSSIFELIALKDAQLLSSAIGAALQQLYYHSQYNDSNDDHDSTDAPLIMDLSEAIMTFDRYIEFVLLTETVEPSLVLPIINKLYSHCGIDPVDEYYFSAFSSSSVVIANPEKNFEPLSSLNLDHKLLCHGYRSGLAVVLTNKDGDLSAIDKQKVESMSAACALIATHSQTLFWQAANALVTDIEAILPLTIRQKHTLIYLEQQFHNYLPIIDTRFADLVSFACQRDHQSAKMVGEQYASNKLDSTQCERMKGFLFGPNRQVTDPLNEWVQLHINTIKETIDIYSRCDFANSGLNDSAAQAEQIVAELMLLGSTLQLIGLNSAATTLRCAAQTVSQWQRPTPDDFDYLLLALMSAENAIITMAETHTPGEVYLPLNNTDISLHQLNSAYETVIKECRSALASTEKLINEYSLVPEQDLQLLKAVPPTMSQVAGALSFLQLSTSATMLKQLAKFLTPCIESNQLINSDILAYIADVLVSVDYYLDGSQHKRPVIKQALEVGQHSLSKLLAA